jgi:hypothetical protein
VTLLLCFLSGRIYEVFLARFVLPHRRPLLLFSATIGSFSLDHFCFRQEFTSKTSSFLVFFILVHLSGCSGSQLFLRVALFALPDLPFSE